jgi:hypothetical protein
LKAIAICEILYRELNNIKRRGTMKIFSNTEYLTRILNVLVFTICFLTMFSGCDRLNSSATPVFEEEKILCNYLRAIYKKDLTFELAVANSEKTAVRAFCKKDGFHIPKEGEKVKRPRPASKIVADLIKGRKIDRCKHYGYDESDSPEDQEICACIRSGKSARRCIHKYHDKVVEKL